MITETLLNSLKSLFSSLGAKTTDNNYAVPLLNKTSGTPQGMMDMSSLASVLGVPMIAGAVTKQQRIYGNTATKILLYNKETRSSMVDLDIVCVNIASSNNIECSMHVYSTCGYNTQPTAEVITPFDGITSRAFEEYVYNGVTYKAIEIPASGGSQSAHLTIKGYALKPNEIQIIQL